MVKGYFNGSITSLVSFFADENSLKPNELDELMEKTGGAQTTKGMRYFIEANLGLTFLYGVYFLLLRNETDFSKQRAFLLLSNGCALLFPLIQITSETVYPELLTTISLSEITVGAGTINTVSQVDFLFIVYIAVASIIAIPLLVHAFKLYQAIKARGNYRGNYLVVESSEMFLPGPSSNSYTSDVRSNSLTKTVSWW